MKVTSPQSSVSPISFDGQQQYQVSITTGIPCDKRAPVKMRVRLAMIGPVLYNNVQCVSSLSMFQHRAYTPNTYVIHIVTTLNLYYMDWRQRQRCQRQVRQL